LPASSSVTFDMVSASAGYLLTTLDGASHLWRSVDGGRVWTHARLPAT
jgi:hypothetical protein